MANQPNLQQPWWVRTNKETLSDRVKKVQNINDPTIISDNVQRYSTVALWVALSFTILVSFFSYYKFLTTSFGAAALPMAILLSVLIEFGKNWGTLTTLRIPFFLGWSGVTTTVSGTVMWVALLAISITTFGVSVYNSTMGFQQLSLMLSREKTEQVFAPQTADIDAQIKSTEQRIAQNRATKWKGTTTVDAMRAIKTETKNLETLQRQRETAIQQQRADFERSVSITDTQNNFSAKSLLQIGGWVELLQIILMFMRISSERSLDRTAEERNNLYSPTPQQKNGNYATGPQPNTFFNRQPNGQVRNALTDRHPLFDPHPPTEKTVSQPPFTVSQQNSETVASGNGSDALLQLALKRLKGFAANFDQRHRNNQTVSGNINRILDETNTAIREPGIAPSRAQMIRFYSYLMELLPYLDTKGWPYERGKEMARYILANVPERHENTPA